jgi:pyrroline-5-carboxylate reductase
MHISFIGAGNMAIAMAKGLAALPVPPSLTVSSPTTTRHAAFQALGARTLTDNVAALAGADLVVLACKPQKAAEVVPPLAAAWPASAVLVSLLAGTPTARLEGWLPPGAKVVRSMPNTPLAVGLGMVGVCAGRHASPADLERAESLFAPCGKVLRLADEARMDALTAVSGSGPAYFFRLAEALVDAAMALGFSRDEAVLLVGQTGAGAWAFLQQSGFEAARLRQQVTSPGGTTAAALGVLEQRDFTGLWRDALAAAEARGRELGRG